MTARLLRRVRKLFHHHEWIEDSRQKLDSRTALVEFHCLCGESYRGVAFDPPIVLEPGESVTVGIPLQPERESSLGRDAEGHLVLTLGPGAESPSRKGERDQTWQKLDGLSPLEQYNREGR